MNHITPSKLLNESGLSSAKQHSGPEVAFNHTSIHPFQVARKNSSTVGPVAPDGTSSAGPPAACHMTTERHKGDPKGRAFGATWHIAAAKIVSGSSRRVAGSSAKQNQKKQADCCTA